jgi:hypothetical protein
VSGQAFDLVILQRRSSVEGQRLAEPESGVHPVQQASVKGVAATAITLVLVPTAYAILEDLRRFGRWLFGRA